VYVDGCDFVGSEGASHLVDYRKFLIPPLWENQTATSASAANASIKKPCLPTPSEFCTAGEQCGDHDGTSGPYGNGVGGQGWSFSGFSQVTVIRSGWYSKVTCYLTDWYDHFGSFIETTWDWCEI
jgi:hypothetical protein